jgi:hypothetical protein
MIYNDSEVFPELIKGSKKYYTIDKVFANSGYDSFDNFNISGSNGIEPVINPRKNAKLTGKSPPSSRDKIVDKIKRIGRKAWHRQSEYGKRWSI